MATTRRISIERILCPIDFSDTSHHALAHAAAMAHWYDARLTILYVFANLPTIEAPPLVLEESERTRLIAHMRKWAAIVPPGVPVECEIQDAGYVHAGIMAQIETTKPDLLVLGTHGRSGFQRLFLGSVTEKVIRLVKCPALVVPPRAPEITIDTPVEFNRILCPVDFSDSSLGALGHAVNLAEEADGQLTLLHVMEMPQSVSQEPFFINQEFERVRDVAAQDARRRLNDLIPDEARAYCTVETAVVEGRAYQEILRQAVERRAGLIVMGVHGRGTLDLMLFGSTTHHVIRAATCPVLIVRQG